MVSQAFRFSTHLSVISCGFSSLQRKRMASIFNVTLAVNLIENLSFIYFYLPVCVHVSVLVPCVEGRDQFVGVGSLLSEPGSGHQTSAKYSAGPVHMVSFLFLVSTFFNNFSCLIILLRPCGKQLGERPGFS